MWVKGFKLVGFKTSKLTNLFILNISLHSIVLMKKRRFNQIFESFVLSIFSNEGKK